MEERKQTAQGALHNLGLRILNQAKIELSLSMRYLSRALDKLSFQMDFNTRRMGTEGEKLHFHPEFVFQLYVESPQKLYRLYMHSLLHCLFRHMFKTEGREETLWNLATDIHVEYVLDSIDVPLLLRPAYPFREDYFRKLEKEIKSLSAERIYAYLSAQNLSYAERERLEQEFVKDDHRFWEKLGEEKQSFGADGVEDSEGKEDEERKESSGGMEGSDKNNPPEGVDGTERNESPEGMKANEKSEAPEGMEGSEKSEAPEGMEGSKKSGAPEGMEGSEKSGAPEEPEGSEKSEAPEEPDGSGRNKNTEGIGKNKRRENSGEREKSRKRLDKDWEDIGKRTEEELKEGKDKDEGDKLSWFLHLEHKNYTPFQDFLRKFSVDREELKTDPESFDYGYYYFGLSQYGNMPLIEENEYREKRKIPELVIAIDTSYSTKGEMVKRFLEETLAILQNKEAFFSKCRVHIVECDDRIRKDILVENAEEMEHYRQRFEVSGGYGTDFRPVFHYIEDLRKKGELKELKALLYFTDGRGRYPKYAPGYTAAFVFPKGEDIDDENAPFWAMKLYI